MKYLICFLVLPVFFSMQIGAGELMKDAISLDKETSKGLRLSFETLSELGIDTDFNVQIINKPHEYVYIFVETDATNHDRGNTTDGIMIEMRYSKETGKIIHQFVR